MKAPQPVEELQLPPMRRGPALFWTMIPIAIVAAIATFAAVQEGHYIRTGKVTKCA